MRIFNIMMSRDLGGIQQAYIDYSEALLNQGHTVINISSSGALINKQLKSTHSLPNLAPWCLLSKIYLNILIRKYNPDIIICHGNRSINFASGTNNNQTKIVGISHNYSYKKLQKCNYIITLTEDLKQNLIKNGVPEFKLLQLSNMVRIERTYNPTPYQKPLIIGSLGRFVTKKGFYYLINSISLLKKSGLNIKLILGGDGDERENLETLVKKLDLENEINFIGWVKDKDAFFNQIDIFCLPSINEPFGIILLEAIERSKPIVATHSGGPQEIIRHKQDGLIANIESAESLAENLTTLINDKKASDDMSNSAYKRLKEKYDIKIVSKQLSKILRKINL